MNKKVSSAARREKIVQSVTEELLKLLGVTAKVSVEEAEDVFQVILESDESGMLIGYHGETLDALQLILSLCISKQVGEFVRVSLEIGDYRKNRLEYLENLVAQTKERVLADHTTVQLPNLKPWERRAIHVMLQDDKEILSESMGEGRDRVLTIRPRE